MLSTRWNSRRSFLRLGGLLPWGMGLEPWLTRGDAYAATAPKATAKSCILLWLDGGPSHLEMWDPKIDAPSEVRGPFGSMATSIPGVHFSENLRQLSALAHRMTIIRSMTSPLGEHGLANNYMLTGYQPSPSLEYPSVGSIVAQQRKQESRSIPSYIGIPEQRIGMGAGFLGVDAAPFITGGAFTGGDPVSSVFRVRDLDFYPGIDAVRFQRRRDFLSELEGSALVHNPRGTAMDLATEMVSSPMAKEAFDVQREPASVRERYGNKTFGQSCLLARRLVEHGVMFVTVRVPGWDDHKDLEKSMRGKGPRYDQAIAALVSDLGERGLDRNVLVVAMGEFGRTPKVNKTAGRDHWGRVMSVLMAGGGLKMGQVIGATDANGAAANAAPYRPQHVLTMIYRHLGINPDTTLEDNAGRPWHLLAERGLIRELV